MLLSFPRQEAVGEVDWYGGTAPALGVLEIPDDAEVALYISGDEPVSLEFMRSLPRDKIYDLNIQGPLVAESFQAVTHLAPGLRYLQLVATNLADDDLRSVAELRGLVDLQCQGNGFTSNGLRQLVTLNALEYLCLEEEGLSASGLDFLTRLPSLRQLTGLGDAGMAQAEVARLSAMIPWATVC